jgi:hypothetical protein
MLYLHEFNTSTFPVLHLFGLLWAMEIRILNVFLTSALIYNFWGILSDHILSTYSF